MPRSAKLTSFFNIGIRFNQKKKLNGTFQVNIGSLTSQNPDYQYKDDITATPNTFFKTSVVSIHYDMAYNFIVKSNYRIFAGLGVGLLRYQPKDDLDNKLLDQPETRPDGETYSNTSAVIPIKIGGTYFLPNNFGLEVQGLMMNPQTDFLDNISGWGNRDGNDQYFMIQLNMLIPLNLKPGTE